MEETSPLENVAEMHKVMCESKWPDKRLQERPGSSENHTKDEKMLHSVRVTSVDVRQSETLRVVSRRSRRVKCTARQSE